MKNTMRKAMLSTIAMLVVAVMSLTGVTYAWFTAGDTATVSGMTMQVETAAGGLEVSTDGSAWKTTLTLDPGVLKTGIKPTSTADAKDFVSLNSYNPTNSAQANFVVADANNYITQYLFLGNSGTSDLKVDLRKTYVEDIANTANNDSKTAIADAARIAIFTVDPNTQTETLVGIMNPYKNAEGTIVDAAETYNGVKASAVGEEKYVEFGAASGDDIKSITTTTTDGLEVTVPKAAADGTRGVLKIKVVVWLEGQDAKCINANAGGAFNIALQFNKTDAVLAN